MVSTKKKRLVVLLILMILLILPRSQKCIDTNLGELFLLSLGTSVCLGTGLGMLYKGYIMYRDANRDAKESQELIETLKVELKKQSTNAEDFENIINKSKTNYVATP